jgi:hypothetical protein
MYVKCLAQKERGFLQMLLNQNVLKLKRVAPDSVNLKDFEILTLIQSYASQF